MWLRYPIIALLFFILALFQISFLAYFNIMGITPNLVFILFFILIFYECLKHTFFATEYFFVFSLIVLAGFLLDVFSYFYFGLSIISLLGVYLLVKLIIYFIRENQDKYFIIYFLAIFLLCFFIYNALLDILSNTYSFNKSISIELLYNLALACLGFYIYKKIDDLAKKGKQLSLFN